MRRPAVEVADLLHKQGDRFMDKSPWLNFQQLSVLRAITRCRTAALGGHIDTCSRCGQQAISYNSCLEWAKVQAKLEVNAEKLWSLNEMERTGGEPDVVGYDKKTGEYIFYDCSAETPKGRRSLCYDREALDSRKEFKPKDSAMGMAAAMGLQILTEDQYRELQKLGDFDT